MVGKKLCSLDMVARPQAFGVFELFEARGLNRAEAVQQDDTDRVLGLFSRINKVLIMLFTHQLFSPLTLSSKQAVTHGVRFDEVSEAARRYCYWFICIRFRHLQL
jgi:hypothetical protein